jgi:hypothetical protein
MRPLGAAGIPINWYALARAGAANAVVVAGAVDLLGDCLAALQR